MVVSIVKKTELLYQIFCLYIHLTAIQGKAWRCLFLSQLLFPSVITEQQLNINLAALLPQLLM